MTYMSDKRELPRNQGLNTRFRCSLWGKHSGYYEP
jgi:hypothetical protein